jgi:outer membrane protein TolC
MKTLLISTLAALGWMVPATVAAQPAESFAEALENTLGRRGGLTADQAARRAQTTSPSIEAARADLRAASEQTTVASLGLVPRVTVRNRFTRFSEVDEPEGLPIEVNSIVNQMSAELALEVPLSDYVFRLPSQMSAAENTEDATFEQLDATRQDVALRARLVYWAWARARLAVVVTEQALAQAQAHLADTRANHDAGNASLADVLRADAAVSSNELALVRTRASEARLADELRTITHLPRNRALEIGESLESTRDGTDDLASLLRDAYILRPELRALRALASAERDRATVARTNAMPRANAFAVGQLQNPNQREFPQ